MSINVDDQLFVLYDSVEDLYLIWRETEDDYLIRFSAEPEKESLCNLQKTVSLLNLVNAKSPRLGLMILPAFNNGTIIEVEHVFYNDGH